MKTLITLSAIAVMALLEVNNYAYSAPVAFQSLSNFSGSGCPTAQSVSVTGTNSENLSLSFDVYEAGASATGLNTDRATCEFTLHINVEPGYQLANITVDWKGIAQGQAQFKRQYFFNGEEDDAILAKSAFSADGDSENFQESDELQAAVQATNCGSASGLQVHSSMSAKNDDSYITVKRTERQHKTTFKVEWRKC